MHPRRPPNLPKITAEWMDGPRTPAWESLWQHVFSEALDRQSAADDFPRNHKITDQGKCVDEVDTND